MSVTRKIETPLTKEIITLLHAGDMDALAITGDEGRGSLRKASGSWQASFDPEMSEWYRDWETRSEKDQH